MSQPDDVSIKRRERAAFVLVTAVVFPVLTVLLIAAYGFIVWFSQWFLGPPTGN